MKTLSNLDLNQNELRNALIHPLSSPPEGGQTGQIYYNVSEDRLYSFDGDKWRAYVTEADLEDQFIIVTCTRGEPMEGVANVDYLINVSMTPEEMVEAINAHQNIIVIYDGMHCIPTFAETGDVPHAAFSCAVDGGAYECHFVKISDTEVMNYVRRNEYIDNTVTDLANYYTKDEVSAMLGSYVNDIAALVGGDA